MGTASAVVRSVPLERLCSAFRAHGPYGFFFICLIHSAVIIRAMRYLIVFLSGRMSCVHGDRGRLASLLFDIELELIKPDLNFSLEIAE